MGTGELKKTHCAVTAHLPDGARDTHECEAASVNRAVIDYLTSKLGNGKVDRTTPETVFEVVAKGQKYTTTKQRVWDWANRQAR